MKAFEIADTVIEPGTRKTVNIPVANLYTHTPMDLPIHVIHGRRTGPKLFVSAAIHGDEINGVEIIRRLLANKSLNSIRGTLITIPIVNMFGLIQHSRYLPDRRDLNRSFPGSPRGSLAARLAHIFMEYIVRQCDYGIDLHTGAIHRSNLPQIRARLDDKETKELASAFGVPVILNSDIRDGSLREAASNCGVKTLLYEAGEALRFDELSIRPGVRGILRVMRHLGMLSETRKRKRVYEPYVATSTSWIRAPHGGVFHAKKNLGDHVNKKEPLGTIADPTDMFNTSEFPLHSNRSGIVIGKSNMPLVNEGDALYHIAYFDDTPEVAQELETFQQNYEAE